MLTDILLELICFYLHAVGQVNPCQETYASRTLSRILLQVSSLYSHWCFFSGGCVTTNHPRHSLPFPLQLRSKCAATTSEHCAPRQGRRLKKRSGPENYIPGKPRLVFLPLL